jgi:hypothetical protein
MLAHPEIGYSKRRRTEKQESTNSDKKAQQHRNTTTKEELYQDLIVYFTIAIATKIPPRNLINGIRMEWKPNSGGKLQVKHIQE